MLLASYLASALRGPLESSLVGWMADVLLSSLHGVRMCITRETPVRMDVLSSAETGQSN